MSRTNLCEWKMDDSTNKSLKLTDPISKDVSTVATVNKGHTISNVNPHFERETSLDLSTSSNKSSSNETDVLRKKKCFKTANLKLIILWTFIGVMLGLLVLPIVFYSLPVPEGELANQTNSSLALGTTNQLQSESEVCISTLSYDGPICQMELQSWGQCFPNTDHNNYDGTVLIQNNVAQEIESLISALESPLLGASDECKAAALPFLCVYFFGLCDSTGRAYTPSSSQCTEISTGVCAREWSVGMSFGIPLPECGSLPDENVLIETCESESNQTTGEHDADSVLGPDHIDPNVSMLSNSSIKCREDFFYDQEYHVCRPACGLISEYPPVATIVLDVMIVMSTCIGIVCGITVLVIASYRWKNIFTFPSTLIVYQTITLLISASVVLLGYIGRRSYLCGSPDLVESFMNPTPFCTISGILSLYTVFQFGIWTILHIIAIFWLTQFPIHASSFKYTKCIHILFVAMGILIPLVPVVAAIAEGHDSQVGWGFRITEYPPNTCIGANLDLIYYSVALPMNILMIVGLPLLVLIFWNIHKRQASYNIPSGRQSPTFKIGRAEKKILIVFIYYSLLSALTLTYFTTRSRKIKTGEFADSLIQYITCEQKGYDLVNPCDRSGFETLSGFLFRALVRCMFDLAPVVNLIYVINIEVVKGRLLPFVQLCRKQSNKLRFYSSRSTDTLA